MLIGSANDDVDFIRLIEDGGAIVVADTVCFGSRTYANLVDEKADPVHTLASHYLSNSVCPRMLGYLAALWLLVTGLGILTLGLPPSGEEVLRGLAFLVTAIAYGGVWLALALMFSVIFRSAATAALASLAIWLLFAFFWQMLVPIVTQVVAPPDPYNPYSILHSINVALGISRLSPNTLFAETTLAYLNPSTRSLGPVLTSQMQNAIPGSPLPIGQSMILVWPQLTGLIAGVIVLFSVAYVLFQRQEVRA